MKVVCTNTKKIGNDFSEEPQLTTVGWEIVVVTETKCLSIFFFVM